jgi:hypothetical protein
MENSEIVLGYRLKLSGGVPKYPIVNKTFDIELAVVDEVDQIRYNNLEVPLVYRAIWEGTNELCPSGLVEIFPRDLTIKTNGTTTASITIKEVSALHNNNKVVIIFEERQKGDGSIGPDSISPTSTSPLCCVRHKLTIEDWDEKERLMTAPYVWYKDEGGKDKCIELKVSLSDECDRKVHNRVVPLKATLIYECGQEVQQQNILVINLHDSKVSIDESGEGIIKLRINEVSNRHRSQRFQIMVSAEHQPDCSDISPAFSIPVDVKSKRNNRPRDGDPMSTSASMDNMIEPAAKRKMSMKPSGGGYESHTHGLYGASAATAMPLGINNSDIHSQIKKAKQTKAQTHAMSQAVVANMTSNLNNYTNNQGQNQYDPNSSGVPPGGSSTGGENLSCAVDHVIR